MKNAMFLAFDDKCEILARACFNSIKRNYPQHPQILVHYAGSSPAILELLQSIERLELIRDMDVKALTDSFAWTADASRVYFYRYFAWSDIFSNFDNILYLDVDTLILKPLDEMLDTAGFLIVPNHEPGTAVFRPKEFDNPELQALLNEDKLPLLQEMDDMCNAGVFVIPKQYRTPAYRQQLFEITRRYKRFLAFADQSAISIWCKINEIGYSRRFDFNFQSPLFNSDLSGYSEDNIQVLHFSWPTKPHTFDFMRWGRIDRPARLRLAKLFFSYVYDKPVVCHSNQPV
jgi:lipopolysaccharide biosynthesis glycosyltransferase